MTKPYHAPSTQPRVVRVFISSTFSDMQAERDELVKRVFPQLRKLCEQRGVIWGEVDLRWGVTDEQRAEGRVLPVCLDEIRRCRPYFIGLLGERYGWIPGEIPEELVRREPWLAQHRDHSVTELEMLHGVLNDPGMVGNAFFYFRDQAYIENLSVSEQEACRERPTEQDINIYGFAEATRRAENRRQKLAALKERIRKSGVPLCEDYSNPRALGEWVMRDLTALINRLFPEVEQTDPLKREAAEHEAFASSRTGIYIGRQEYFDLLDTHAQGDDPPLVVLGESGSGKSALLANWAQLYKQTHPDELVLMHFIGATPHSADWSAMLRRFLYEFKQSFDLPILIPDQPDALRAAFANGLYQAAAKGRLILVLDALNQLEDRDGAPDLVWLPPVIPPNVRLVLSTLPGRSLEELKKRGWPVLQVEPLGVDERKLLIETYLAQYGKILSASHLKNIADAPQASNPLYLRVLLDELRLFGVHEKLDERISHYLMAATPDTLFEKMLERCEQDYERNRPNLVKDALSLLWAARRGLSEVELLELLGSNGMPLPGAHWSPLHLAMEGSLLSLGGLISFGHGYLRQAVQNRYLPGQEAQRSSHLRLANYFKSRALDPRKVDELPWQLTQAAAWKQLYSILADLYFFEVAWKADEYEVKAYWSQVEANSPLELVQAYHPVVVSPAEYTDHIWNIARLLTDMGHPLDALSLWKYLSEHFRQIGDRSNLAASFGNQALILTDRGDLDEAMALHKQQERICLELGDESGLQTCLGNQALIFSDRGDLDGAMALHKEQERICRKLGNKAGLQACLGNQAVIFKDRGDLDGAMALHKEEERLCRELGDKHGLSITLGNQALILTDRGDLDRAMTFHKEEEGICRELGDKNGLARTLGNQALVLASRGDLDQAMVFHKEEERLCRELGNKRGLHFCLGNQALIFSDRGDLDGAMALHKQQEQICLELGDKRGLAACLGNQANILSDRGDLDGAIALHKQDECICRELGNKDGLQGSLGNQANILYARGDLDGAMALHKEKEAICRELGNKDSLARALGNQAVILYARGDLDGAMALHKEKEAICRELGNKDGLARALGNQALILHARGDLDGAMALHKEDERLCLELGNKMGLQACLGNEANILYDRGDLDGAMALHKEEERLCRELGNKDGLIHTLGNQANILVARDDLDKAMALYQEQQLICRELGNMAGLGTSFSNQAAILAKRGELGWAIALYQEQERICRELGNKEGLAITLINQALILGVPMDQPREALPLAEEAYNLATGCGFIGLAQQIEGIRAKIRERLGNDMA